MNAHCPLCYQKSPKQTQKQKHIEQEVNVAINSLVHPPPSQRELLLTVIVVSVQNFYFNYKIYHVCMRTCDMHIKLKNNDT